MPTGPPIVALGEVLWDLLPSGPRAGGAPFNFAFHCHQLGHPAVIVSRVGDDDLGRQLRSEVRRLGLSDEYIQTDREHPTGTVQVSVGAGGQPTYTITENVAWDFIEWEPGLEALAESARAVCFGTLAQRQPVSRETIWQFLGRVPKANLAVCDINLRPPFTSADVIARSATGADWLKLNEEEADEVIRSLGETVPRRYRRASDLAGLLLEATGCELVCVTEGAKGGVVRTEPVEIDYSGIPVQVADTVGAGDAFTAALLTGILLTQSLEALSLNDTVQFANAYAAVVASKPGGTPIVTRAEVERLL